VQFQPRGHHKRLRGTRQRTQRKIRIFSVELLIRRKSCLGHRGVAKATQAARPPSESRPYLSSKAVMSRQRSPERTDQDAADGGRRQRCVTALVLSRWRENEVGGLNITEKMMQKASNISANSTGSPPCQPSRREAPKGKRKPADKDQGGPRSKNDASIANTTAWRVSGAQKDSA